MIDKIAPKIQEAGDVCGTSLLCVSFFGWVPNVTAVLALLWFALRIWESDTVRELTNREKSG